MSVNHNSLKLTPVQGVGVEISNHNGEKINVSSQFDIKINIESISLESTFFH